MEIKEDGTQTFTCKIPKFYLSEEPNEMIINPRWQDTENGILAENTRVLKISVIFSDNDTKVFPFIIDKITNKRDKNFSVYKEISCNGFAFAELGKIGYKIELNSHTLETDFAEDDTTIASINYWLDKIFPNEKDENGIITRWLTPWCYEIRMDWSGYFNSLSDTFIDGGVSTQTEGFGFYDSRNSKYLNEETLNWLLIDAGDSGPLYQLRDESIIYEDPYVSNWSVINNKLTPISVVGFKEKARYVDCTNSNKYNITQTLAETFGVFCTYEYSCESDGHFKKTYWDDANNVWTGKKVVFFNKAIKSDNPYTINYQNNLNGISRVIDSSEVYTKMYVNPIASETMDTGYVSIADTNINPLLDDFILNFDYLYEIGSINDLQKQEIEKYEINLHQLNKKLIDAEEQSQELAVQLNELESQRASEQAALESAEETLLDYEKQAQNLSNSPVTKGAGNAYSFTLVPKDTMGIIQGTLRLEGINVATISGYADSKYTKKIFGPRELIHAQNPPSNASSFVNKWYVTKDEYGFPATIFTSSRNTKLKEFFGENFDVSTGAQIYLALEYFPKNKYEIILNSLRTKIQTHRLRVQEILEQIGTDEGEESNWSGIKKQIKENSNYLKTLYEQKDALNFKLERLLGPALREGYWQPETYEDPGEGHNIVIPFEKRAEVIDNVSFIYDEEPFEDEQLDYYYESSDDVINDNKTYYRYIELSKSIYENIGVKKWVDDDGKENLCLASDFHIVLYRKKYRWILQSGAELKANQGYFFLLDGQYYSFTCPKKYGANTIVTIDASKTPIELTINGNKQTLTDPSTTMPEIGEEYNITGGFQGANQYLSTRHLYNNSGFVYAFLKRGNTIDFVALINQKDIDYDIYTVAKAYYDKASTIEVEEDLRIQRRLPNTTAKLVYPRFFIDYRNVNSDSENFKIYTTQDSRKLTNFEDYQILKRDARVYVNLKITDTQLPLYILEAPYNIIFQVSRANEQLYLDAKRVAKDSSKPKYSYEITVANIPDEITILELGQLCHINDYTIDAYKEYGYISGLTYALDKPSQDQITISNYKTKFEDLFSSISAQNETMKQNQSMYNIALASFTSQGEIQPTVIQTTLDNNNFVFNFSDTHLQLDDTGGLVLTNDIPYNNGIYGQVALRGNGLWCSDSINDETGERTWHNAITPKGINASYIAAGLIDTSLIRIMSGNEAAFQWNSEGLYAYKNIGENGVNKYDDKSFVKFNEDGLLYQIDGKPQLALGWDGLRIEGANGHMRLTSANGLQMFDDNGNVLATFGKFGSEYGMFLTDASGNIVLRTTNKGELRLDNLLKIGNRNENNNYAGLIGNDNHSEKVTGGSEKIRIWAGSEVPSQGRFIVTEDGTVIAEKIYIVKDNEKILLDYDKLKTLGL